jgi:hypothetical protein
MYAEKNYKSKKELKADVAAGIPVRIFSHGLGTPREDGQESLEGPHYPEAHKWYASVEMKNGLVVKVF